MSSRLRDLAAAAAVNSPRKGKGKGEPVSVRTEGDSGEAVSRIFTEDEADELSDDDLLRGWKLDPAEWMIDGPLLVNRWMVSARIGDRDGEAIWSEHWNYQYKARVVRRLDRVFAPLLETPKGCARCAVRKAMRDVKRRDADLGTVHHLWVPDTQVKPGAPTDHLLWAATWVRENYRGRRLKIHVAGDWWHFDSLSSHDKQGTLRAEGRRVVDDSAAGNRAFQVWEEALGDDPLWTKHFHTGNHEARVDTYVNQHPELEGVLSVDGLCAVPVGYVRHGFRDPVNVDGIRYSHYFYAQGTGKSYGGPVEERVRKVGHSFVMGHEQGFRYGEVQTNDGERRLGVVAGSFYQPGEDYRGPQAQDEWRGLVVLHDVADGYGDLMKVSIDYLCRRYTGRRLADHQGVVL